MSQLMRERVVISDVPCGKTSDSEAGNARYRRIS